MFLQYSLSERKKYHSFYTPIHCHLKRLSSACPHSNKYQQQQVGPLLSRGKISTVDREISVKNSVLVYGVLRMFVITERGLEGGG